MSKVVVEFLVGDIIDVCQQCIDPGQEKSGPPKEAVVTLEDAILGISDE